MRSKKYFLLCAAGLVLCLAFTSCLSFGADAFMNNNLTDQEKAEVIFQKGLALYNERLMELNDLKAIPEVRAYFAAALKADPLHVKAQEYLAKTDSFKTLRFQGYLKTAQKLKEKKTRTESEDYELVLSTQRALDINSLDGELIKLRLETADLRKQVVQKRVARLAELEKKLREVKTPAEVAKLVPQSAKLIAEIQLIDPGNRDSAAAKKSIDELVLGNARKDIDEAAARLKEKKFPDAEAAIVRAEKTWAGVSKAANPEISGLKYKIYMAWAADLLATKKYQSADARVNLALAIDRSPEALDLKAKIAKAGGTPVAAAKPAAGAAKPAAGSAPKPAAVQDFDAEIDDMLAVVDSAIARGDLAGAWDLANANMVKLVQQANKDKMASRKATITAKMKTLYTDSVASYNEEDYETARDGFRIIVKINSGYEQAQAYLDRANNKIRALSGDE